MSNKVLLLLQIFFFFFFFFLYMPIYFLFAPYITPVAGFQAITPKPVGLRVPGFKPLQPYSPEL
jgi:hypothetical protein